MRQWPFWLCAILWMALVGCNAASTPRVATPLPAATPTAIPVAEDETLVICTTQEPNSLLWSERTLATAAIREAIQEPLIDERGYDYQANLVTKLPTFQDGDAALEPIEIGIGDRFYDVRSDRVLTLTLGMTDTFALAQYDAAPVEYQGWNGPNLKTVQLRAEWTLKHGLTWEDGSPVTADDSVFAYEVERHPSWPASHRLVERTASYVAMDDHRVEWRGLPGYTDNLFFLNVFAPQPRHLYGPIGIPTLLEDERVNRQPLSYGAYRIVEWRAGDQIMLVANENYIHGPPPLEEIIVRFVPDSIQVIAQVASGSCDIALQDAGFESYYSTLTKLEDEGVLRVEAVAGTSFEHLDFNISPAADYTGAAATLRDSTGQLLVQRVEFRQAVAFCLDRQAMVDQVINGAAFIPPAYIPTDHPFYPGDAGLQLYTLDSARARTLLDQLGWRDSDSDGVLDNGQGQRLTLRLSTRSNGMRERVLQVIQEQLAANCGIETVIELKGADFFADGDQGELFGRRYDLAEFAWLTGVEAPCNLYISSEIPSEATAWGGNNNTGFSLPAFDAACTTALQTLDPEQKRQAHADAVRLFTENLPSIPLFTRAKITLVRPYVIGVKPDPTANSEMWNVENFDLR